MSPESLDTDTGKLRNYAPHDLSSVDRGHIIAVTLGDGSEALAHVLYKKWASRNTTSVCNPFTEDASVFIRVEWLRATGSYVQGWYRDYNGEISHSYEANFPCDALPDACGKRLYGWFRVLDRDEVVTTTLCWLYGPDRDELMKQSVARAYGIACEALVKVNPRELLEPPPDPRPICQGALRLCEILAFGPRWHPHNPHVYVCEVCGHEIPWAGGDVSGLVKFTPHPKGQKQERKEC